MAGGNVSRGKRKEAGPTMVLPFIYAPFQISVNPKLS
jgi:hypothetical protein